jgi:TolB-like protein/DNA-binding winged helix-turn-helix (wHTH) protein
MSKVDPTEPILRFGAYDVDLRSGEVRKSGIRIKLQPKPFQVLSILLANPGRAITREELQNRLWAPDTFVDFDHGLNTAVSKIRDALNDPADNPRFIETLPNGYRFIAPVSAQPIETPTSQPPESEPKATPRAEPKRFSRLHLALGAVAAILLIAGVPALRYLRSLVSPHRLEVHSIAILPLRNLSGDPTQDYFADGMTDELITQMAKVSSLRVVSAVSAMGYKNTTLSTRQLGRELNVDAFVEGSVLRSGDRVRVTVQLIDVATDAHVWAEDYNRDTRDVMFVQSDIASAIATKVRAKIAPNENEKLPSPHPVDPRAYDAYLAGRGYWLRGKTPANKGDDLPKSQEAFLKAIAYDASYAPAYSGLANYYGLMAGLGDLPVADNWKLSEQAARKALSLDDSVADAHFALATKLMFYDWDWSGAEQEIHRGLAFDPHFAELHNLYSHLLAYRGRFDESIAEARRAEELDPLGEYNSVQRALKFSRRYDLFLSEMERTFANNPVRIHENKAWVHRARKEYAQEVQETDQQLRLQGRVRYADLLARAYASGGYRAWLEAQLVELKQQSEKRRVSPFEFAEAYAALRDADKTMHYLELGYQERTADMVRIQVNPAYDDLHLDPRYRDLVRRVGLPQ